MYKVRTQYIVKTMQRIPSFTQTQQEDETGTQPSSKTKGKEGRCPKGERRKYFPDGTYRCVPITEDEIKRNQTRKIKAAIKAAPTEPIMNPPRCPKGQRKVYLNAEKTQWICQDATDDQKEINEKKRQLYEEKKNAADNYSDARIQIKRKVLKPTLFLEEDEDRDIGEVEAEEKEDEVEAQLEARLDSIVAKKKQPINLREQWEKQLIVAKSDEVNDASSELPMELDRLYPSLDDTEFSQQIVKKQEFAQNRYDPKVYNVESRAEQLCNLPLEFHPYQVFVKHFLSPHSPYNGMLLYHGLGTGKTMTAVGVCEEMRHYMKSIGQRKPIYVICSHNISQNFKQALFDENMLPDNLNPLSPETLPIYMAEILREMNPTMKFPHMTKEKLGSMMRKFVKTHYVFMGYTKFGMEIAALLQDAGKGKKIGEISKRNIRKRFSNTMIVVDEVHNIRHQANSGDSEKYQTRGKVGELLMLVARYADNMRLLLMSATPVFDSPLEIVQIANLLNANDKRSTIDRSQVFYMKDRPDKGEREGDFRVSIEIVGGGLEEDSAGLEDISSKFEKDENSTDISAGNTDDKTGKGDGSLELDIEKVDFDKYKNDDKVEVGKALLKRKLNGYVSFVRGENPYSFPFRIYPHLFEKSRTFAVTQTNRYEEKQDSSEPIPYPTLAYDGTEIAVENRLKYTCLYADPLSDYQKQVYEDLVQTMLESETKQSFTWGRWVQSLNIVFPGNRIGDEGFQSVMNVVGEKYSYKGEKIFSKEKLGTYSAKIASILSCIERGSGISLVYSQYLYSGITSMALALEEAGYSRYGFDNLLNKRHGESKGKYMLITGESKLTPDMMKVVTSEANKDGELIQVVLISEAGSEGIDFKNIRQVHIMEPWYNLNRMEQVIGRAIRYKSHCALPFTKRNVEIYLHTAYTGELGSLDGSSSPAVKETMDAYIYRVYAEPKAIQIGQVNRLLKQTAVDLHLNVGQMNMTVADLQKLSENMDVTIELSSKKDGLPLEMNYPMGDKPYTAVCDYEDSCRYTDETWEWGQDEIHMTTYSVDHLRTTRPVLIRRIQELFKEYDFLTRDEIMAFVNNGTREYSVDEMFYVLSYLIQHPHEVWKNRKNQWGYLMEQGDVFLFQTRDRKTMSTTERLLASEGTLEGVKTPAKVVKMSVESETKEEEEIDLSPGRFKVLMANWKRHLDTLFEVDNSDESDEGESDDEKDDDESDGDEDSWWQELTKVYKDKKTKTEIQILPLVLSVFTRDQVEKALIHHYIESLDYTDKVVLLHYSFQDKESYPMVVEYFREHTQVSLRDTLYYVLLDLSNDDPKARWHFFDVDGEEETGVLERPKLLKTYYEQSDGELSKVIGCLDFHVDSKTNSHSYALKLKETDKKTSYYKGTLCAHYNIHNLSSLLNELDIQELLKEYPVLKFGKCILTEIFMRLNSSDEKKYFTSREQFYKYELLKILPKRKK